MKKFYVLAVLTMVLVGSSMARAPFTELKVGYFNPDAAKSGYLFGVNLGRMIDESLSWSFELNYFQKGYRKTATIATEETQGGTQIQTKQLSLDFKTRIIPFLLKLNYEHPLGYRSPFYARASAGLGWEMVWNNENNYLENKETTRFFHGFGWQVAGGVGFEISSSANFFTDIFYNGSTVKRNKTVVNGLPTWEQLDISGIGIKIGVSIVGFGW